VSILRKRQILPIPPKLTACAQTEIFWGFEDVCPQGELSRYMGVTEIGMISGDITYNLASQGDIQPIIGEKRVHIWLRSKMVCTNCCNALKIRELGR